MAAKNSYNTHIIISVSSGLLVAPVFVMLMMIIIITGDQLIVLNESFSK